MHLIFDRLHQTLPLTSYLVSQRIDSPEERRSALMQRGAIMARKKRWDVAISDFGLALEESRGPLTIHEKRILRRATGLNMTATKYSATPISTKVCAH